MPNNDNEPFLKFDDFNGGVVDAFGQGKEPSNSLADSQNFTPFLKKSLITVHGYSKTGGLAALPTGFAKTSGTGTYDVAKIVSEIYPFSSANPVSYDGRVYFFTDNQGSPVNHVMLDTWFKGSTTAQTANGGFIPLDDHKTLTSPGADITITGASTYTLTIANASATWGLPVTNGAYDTPPWIIQWFKSSDSTYHHATIKTYAYSAGTATITTYEDLGSAHANWSSNNNDIFTFWRWFHQQQANGGYAGPDFATIPGQCFQSSGRVRGCGGAASNLGYSPWIAQYIDRTFFTGIQGGTLYQVRYQGTYVDEMRCRSSYSAIIGGLTGASIAGPVVLPNAQYGFYANFEYDGYEEGELTYQTGIGVIGQYLTFNVFVPLATVSKRVTAINLYVSQFDPTTGAESDPYFIRRYDIVTPKTSECDATYGWYWDVTGGSFLLDLTKGTSDNSSYNVKFDGTDWYNRGASYLARTGRVQETKTLPGGGYSGPTLGYVNWQYTESVNGRQFFANFYDPNTSLLNTNSIKFTGFDVNANGTIDVIPADPLYNQTNVSPGTGQAIQGLAGQNGWLYAFLNPGIYGFSITPYPEQWVKYPISLIDGLYSTKSLGKMPEGGGIYFADVDHLKLLNNQKITSLTVTIPNLYYNLSNKSSIRAWYDKLDRAICFSNGVSGQHYRGYSELQYPLTGNYLTGNLAMGVPWFPALYTDNIEFVTMLRDASIVFTNQTLNGVFQVHLNDQTFSGAGIVPYLKTNSYFMDDKDSVSKGLVDRVHVHLYDIGNTGTLDCKMTIDGDAHTFSNIDKTMGHIFMKYPVTVKRYGRHMFFEFNTNASGMYDISGDVQLTEIVFYGQNIRFFVKNET